MCDTTTSEHHHVREQGFLAQAHYSFGYPGYDADARERFHRVLANARRLAGALGCDLDAETDAMHKHTRRDVIANLYDIAEHRDEAERERRREAGEVIPEGGLSANDYATMMEGDRR